MYGFELCTNQSSTNLSDCIAYISHHNSTKDLTRGLLLWYCQGDHKNSVVVSLHLEFVASCFFLKQTAGHKRGMMRCLFVAAIMASLPLCSFAWISSSTLRPKQIDSVKSTLCRENFDKTVFVTDNFHTGNNSGKEVATTASERQPSNVLDIRIPEPRLLAVDLIAVAIGVHLMAFADVMNDPLQFAPPNPSPLPLLMERDSLLSVCWVLSALTVNGYQQETVASNAAVVKSTMKIAAGFALLRVALGVVSGYFIPGVSNLDVWETARQCYITAITVGALRFFYGQYNR